MPSADLTEVLEPSMPPPLTFAPIDEAPVPPGKTFGPCLLGLADGSNWVIGRWNGEGWYDLVGGFSINPSCWALLPPVPSRPQELSRLITALLGNGEYDVAARLIDELADMVRAARTG